MATASEIREAAENDLLTFIRLVAPHRVLGDIHKELITWWTRQERKTHQLVLLPRAHQKSVLIAYRVAWEITRNPLVTILYISSTANLAETQLRLIKDILTSKIYRRYWPEMVNPDEGKREKWTSSEISVDHPRRKEEGIRDSTIFTAGLTTNITGLHCDIAVKDDVVTHENAATEEGRKKVKFQFSLLSSIQNPDSQVWVVGTRYHPNDLYADIQAMKVDLFDSDGNIYDSENVYEVFERAVEDRGDGTGQFIWPRQQRADGKWFGFDAQILAKKKAEYLDQTQFRAQYYNDPNDRLNQAISEDMFQYYEPKYLKYDGEYWFYKDRRLNVYAAIDFAFSKNKKADFTALVVIGIDHQHNIFVLDIDRLKTDRIVDYFSAVKKAYLKWGFKKLRAEVTVAQQSIVRELKEVYLKPEGLILSIDEYRPTRNEGTKQERIRSILEPRYDNLQVWHYLGGNTQILEEELKLQRPPHDDVKDALASAVDVAVAPKNNTVRSSYSQNIVFHPRFGGVAL